MARFHKSFGKQKAMSSSYQRVQLYFASQIRPYLLKTENPARNDMDTKGEESSENSHQAVGEGKNHEDFRKHSPHLRCIEEIFAGLGQTAEKGHLTKSF